jgi:hypothetical protein
MCYLLFDFAMMVYNENKRIDMYIHHIPAFISIYLHRNYTMMIFQTLGEIVSVAHFFKKTKKEYLFRIICFVGYRLPFFIYCLLTSPHSVIHNVYHNTFNILSLILIIFLDIKWTYQNVRLLQK